MKARGFLSINKKREKREKPTKRNKMSSDLNITKLNAIKQRAFIRLINYVTAYNYFHPENPKIFICPGNKYNKEMVMSNGSSVAHPYGTRISQILNRRPGGSTQFGSDYLGKPTIVNYLGRVEGQPGGSGMPPLNRF